MTEITPNPLENTRFSDFAILLFYDHPANPAVFLWDYFILKCVKVLLISQFPVLVPVIPALGIHVIHQPDGKQVKAGFLLIRIPTAFS